jgi:hypothetical protein
LIGWLVAGRPPVDLQRTRVWLRWQKLVCCLPAKPEAE